ncbi:hypothetical protein Pmani_028311 [Petrolisthes manimaculis]|uniref:Uncharacterized protein n=1 Tax=Petrolisthes manimaculis TaxID=1843537 RepID=A0AAE1TY43_9EUCA|nr:hypothetical protein Pmani_028311 [Petrolisthes manimaculis]
MPLIEGTRTALSGLAASMIRHSNLATILGPRGCDREYGSEAVGDEACDLMVNLRTLREVMKSSASLFLANNLGDEANVWALVLSTKEVESV